MTENATSQKQTRRRPALRSLLFLGYLAVVSLLLLEVALRLLTKDEAGHQDLFGMNLLPFEVLPRGLDDLLKRSPSECPYVQPDPILGWTIKPRGHLPSKEFASNGLGLRSAPDEIALEKPDGVTRVLLVGDSFTHGDELPWNDTWSKQLQDRLGSGFQVLNGGVPGYGTDQALLRYERELGDKLKPDFVVLGIVRDDIPRNCNLFRAFYHHWTDLPWSKPRFVLEGDGLRLVNCPVVPPEEVAKTLVGFATSPLRRHDSCYSEDYYTSHWWQASRIARYLQARRVHRARHQMIEGLRTPGAEGTLVTARLARRFVDEAGARSAKAIVLLLAQHDDVPSYKPGGHPPLRHLRAAMESLNVVPEDVGPAFFAALKEGETSKSLFVNGIGHPNPRGARLIAEVVAEAIRRRL